MLPVICDDCIIEPDVIFSRTSGGSDYIVFKNESKEAKYKVPEGRTAGEILKQIRIRYMLAATEISTIYGSVKKLYINVMDLLGSESEGTDEPTKEDLEAAKNEINESVKDPVTEQPNGD